MYSLTEIHAYSIHQTPQAQDSSSAWQHDEQYDPPVVNHGVQAQTAEHLYSQAQDGLRIVVPPSTQSPNSAQPTSGHHFIWGPLTDAGYPEPPRSYIPQDLFLDPQTQDIIYDSVDTQTLAISPYFPSPTSSQPSMWGPPSLPSPAATSALYSSSGSSSPVSHHSGLTPDHTTLQLPSSDYLQAPLHGVALYPEYLNTTLPPITPPPTSNGQSHLASPSPSIEEGRLPQMIQTSTVGNISRQLY